MPLSSTEIFLIDDMVAEARDGIGITDTEKISITAQEDDGEILVKEIPMTIHLS
jgi:hypothetical protein